MNIFLIGYRCTGKTSVGKRLAERMGWSFIDADHELVSSEGVTISEMVSNQGWETFREKEKQIIKRLTMLDRQVIATGGGVVTNPENVIRMKKTGVLIWLKAKPETIRKRMGQDKNSKDLRPPLTSKEWDQEIEETLFIRNPLYENAMDFSADTDDLGIEEVCSTVLRKLKVSITFCLQRIKKSEILTPSSS